MIEKSPILVTGIPRSGASIIAGVIQICGAFGGNMSNYKGLLENDAIKESLEKPYLVSIGADEMGQYPLPDEKLISIPVTWRSSVETIMLREGYKGGEWFYKSFRATLLWQIWNNAFPNAKWVIVRRRTADIIESCKKTGYMTAFKNEDICNSVQVNSEENGWLWMIHEYEKCFVRMIMSGLNCKVIYPDRLVYNDYSQLYEMLDWLGLKWTRKIFDYVDPLLETSRKKEREVKYGSTGNSI